MAATAEKTQEEGVETGAEDLGEGEVDDEQERLQHFERLVAEGTPEEEARATVWPDGEEEAEEEPPPPKLLQEALPGDWSEISGEFGGAAPEISEIRLLGGKMPIEGSFAKGTEIDLLVRVRVTGVLGQDVLDDWGRTTRTVRRHMARMISVRRFGKQP